MARRLFAVEPPPQIGPRWENFDGTPTIYRTADAGLNVVSLALDNTLGDTVTLHAGTPVAFGSLPAGQSAVYLFFEGMISNAEVEAILITPLGGVSWNSATFEDTRGFSYLALAPAVEVRIANGEGIAFKLSHLLATNDDFSGAVDIEVVGASGVDPKFANAQVYVNVREQPAVGNQDLDLLVGFAGSDLVYTGGQPNSLTLYLTNPSSVALVPGGSGSWGPIPPTFQLSLLFGDSPGALTTVAEASAIAVDLGEVNGNVWKPVAKQSQGNVPTWIMQPDPNGGGDVLGSGSSATVTFDLSGITTKLPQGLTTAYVAYSDIPGYNDGFFAVEILKVAPIVVSSFTATPPSPLSGQTGPVQVTLAFEVTDASFVMITNSAYAQPVKADTVKDSVVVALHATTAFTLVATSFATGQVVSVPLTVVVDNPDLLATSLVAGTAAIAGQVSAGAGQFVTLVRVDGPVNPALSLGGAATLAVDAPNVPGGRFVVLPNGNVGIGQPSPADTLDVNGSAHIAGALGVNGDLGVAGDALISGRLTVPNGASVTGNVSLSPAADRSRGNVGIGGVIYSNVALMVTNSFSDGYAIYVDSPNMGTNWWAMSVHGPCINTSGSWSRLADATVHEDVRPFEDGLEHLRRIDPVRYRFTAESHLGDREHVGVAAQDLEQIAPYMVGRAKVAPDSEDEHLTVDDSALTFMLVNAVKELSARVEALEADANGTAPRSGTA